MVIITIWSKIAEFLFWYREKKIIRINMTTLPPPNMKPAPSDSIERKVYDIVEKFKDNIPVTNDRYRLAYNLIKYLQGEADIPKILVKSTKIELVNISEVELALKLNEELNKLK